MIINVNGVNVDTNTMRTNAEINSLIDSRTANKTERVLLKSISLSSSTTGPTVSAGTFSFTDDELWKYSQMLLEFKGTFSSTTGDGNGGGYLRIYDGSTEQTLCSLDMENNLSASASDFYLTMSGSSPSKKNRTTGLRTSRAYSIFSGANLVFESSKIITLRLSGYNSVTSLNINGTINIYGIK